MTKKEAIKRIKEVRFTIQPYQYINEALDMAIEALEQEPCEDAVSRQAVNDLYDRYHPTLATCVYEFGEELKALPSVNPTREHGEWIQKEYWSEGCGMGETYGYYYECSKCGNLKKGGYDRCGVNYCPNCGADMRLNEVKNV